MLILYTEAQLLVAYTRYVRKLKESSIIKMTIPTIEEFRIIYETEHEQQFWDEIND
jgi:hypothetical protein